MILLNTPNEISTHFLFAFKLKIVNTLTQFSAT